MVGGRVTYTLTMADRVFINTSQGRTGRLGVYVVPSQNAACVGEGDTIWWMEKWVYWTSHNWTIDGQPVHDVALRRIGHTRRTR